MKKVALVWSSPNSDGLTAAAKDRFMEGLIESGTKVEEIHLNSKRLEHCMACGNGLGNCAKNGKCVIEDDFAQIYGALTQADGIAWVSAVYWADLTECFKAFFDRLRRCESFWNHHLAGKRCVIIACAGGKGGGSLNCLSQLENGLIHMAMLCYDRISVGRYNKDYILPALVEAGKTYARALETGYKLF